MSKHDKKNIEQNQPKVDQPSSNESPEQKEAKRIADMEAKIIALEAKNKKQKEALDAAAVECAKKLASMDAAYQDSYKGQILLKEQQAQEAVKAKLNELEEKAKADLALAKKYAIKDQALDLIDIVVQFEKAVNFTPSDPNIAKWLSGFKMFATKFDSLLSDMGIVKIIPEIGKEFDPLTMECFIETVTDPSKPNNTVVEVIYPGYKLHDRLLKPATVKVVKNN